MPPIENAFPPPSLRLKIITCNNVRRVLSSREKNKSPFRSACRRMISSSSSIVTLSLLFIFFLFFTLVGGGGRKIGFFAK